MLLVVIWFQNNNISKKYKIDIFFSDVCRKTMGKFRLLLTRE